MNRHLVTAQGERGQSAANGSSRAEPSHRGPGARGAAVIAPLVGVTVGRIATTPGLSIRGYARHRGVSHTAVRKALASGRITASPDGLIDPALADTQWSTSTDLSKPRNSVNGVPKKRRAPEAVSDPIGSPGWEGAPGAPAESSSPRLVSSYAASRAAREAYLARLAKLEFEQKTAKLVDADEVRAQIFALGRRMRDTLLGIPDRLAPVLAGQADPAEIHRILCAELVASLAELSTASPIKVVRTSDVRP